jgi:hypothetical protein
MNRTRVQRETERIIKGVERSRWCMVKEAVGTEGKVGIGI